ncbi:hypothetical protein WJ52_25375 [Burkholderia ubonensis]|nr:hypothetical protein WJ52_25375 [Burkholderia ubonensis]
MQKDVDVAELTLIDERAQLIDLLGKQRTLRVGLIGALGGGFDAGAAPNAPAKRGAASASRKATAHATPAAPSVADAPSNPMFQHDRLVVTQSN